MSHSVLIIEDEQKLATLLVDYFSAAGYETATLANGLRATETILQDQPNLVILDLMLPEKDGLTICREVRASSDVPIIMVTARVQEIDRLLGLEIGADDYVCKPYSPREVVARAKAILRRVDSGHRKETEAADGIVRYRGIEIDEHRFSVVVGDAELELTPVEFRLLKTLVSTPGRVFSRQQLMDEIYPDQRIVSDRTMDSHVKNLRKKLGTAAQSAGHADKIGEPESYIVSIYGVGYKAE